MLTQKLKTCNGYHYRDLHVTDQGAIISRVMDTYQPRRSYKVKDRESAYILTTKIGFTVKTNVHTTALRGKADSDLRLFHLLQISTKKGDIFYCIVAKERLRDIALVAKTYIKAGLGTIDASYPYSDYSNPDWSQVDFKRTWKSYIDKPIRSLWNTFSDKQKQTLAHCANERYKYESRLY